MYAFVGRLMGLALRTGSLLKLDLPSMVWKHLVNEVVTPQDVLSIDVLAFKIIRMCFQTIVVFPMDNCSTS